MTTNSVTPSEPTATSLAERTVARFRKLRESAHERFLTGFEGVVDTSFDPEALAEDVKVMLNRERREMVLKILGFSDRWGKLEVADKNDGSSHMVRSYLQANLVPIIQQWMEENLKPVIENRRKGKLMSAQVQKAVETEFDRAYQYEFERTLRAHAASMAREDANNFTEQVKKYLSMDPEKPPA